MNSILLCTTFLVLALQSGYNEKASQIKESISLDVYEDVNNYTGHIVKVPVDMEKYYETMSKVKNRYAVFYKHRGKLYKHHVVSLPYHVHICSKLNQVIVVTVDGVLAIPIAENTYRWIFHKKNILLKARWAFDDSKTKILVSGVNTSPLPVSRVSRLILFIDIPTAKYKIYDIPTNPSGMLFLDESKALVSTGNDLITVKVNKIGSPQFSVQKNAAKKRAVVGALDGKLIFRSDNYREGMSSDEEVVSELWIGDIKVDIGSELRNVTVCNSQIWALSHSGKIFRIGPDGQKTLVDKTIENIIGSGTGNGVFWVAVKEGNVKTFNGSSHIEKIEIPNRK